MSTAGHDGTGPPIDEGIRTLLLLLPKVVGRTRRARPPEDLRSFSLAPRHLSLLAYLLFDGPMAVSELADRLEVAPATVSLMVGELSRQGVVQRCEDEIDRRRTIVSIVEQHRLAIDGWLATGAEAWRTALQPLTPTERQTFIDTLRRFEDALAVGECGPCC